MIILTVTTVMANVLLPLSVGMIVVGCVVLYQWRTSAFSETYAELRNVKRVAENEEAVIQSRETGAVTYRCGKKHKPMVYFEYVYTVNNAVYTKSYFYEDDGHSLPAKCKMHYHMSKPDRAFREGSTKNGVIIAVGWFVLGSMFLLVSLWNLY